MRVLVPSLRGGSGITTYALSLADGLAAAGHEVVLVDETGKFESPDPRITVAPLQSPRQLPYPLEPLAEWGRIGAVRRLAREHAVDGIHATRLGFVSRRDPCVITLWDPIVGPLGRSRAATWRGEPRATEALFAIVDARAARRSRGIVAVTPAIQSSYARFGRCEFIPPFLKDSLVTPARSERGHDVVMVAGMLDLPRKGLELALQAFPLIRERYEDARLILVGDWVDQERRQALPDFCEARGRLDSKELQATFAAAGSCLIPSLWEEFGYSGLEALAAGTTLATAPLPGFEGLSGGGIFVAESREPAAMARQITAALDAGGHEFPAECRASVAVPRLLSLYEQAFEAS